MALAAVPAGAAAADSSLAPVMRVDFRATGVSGKRPPNIVETRIAATGSLTFNKTPYFDRYESADSAKGKVIVEYDVLTPHPQTIRITLEVTDALYRAVDGGVGADLSVEVIRAVDGDGEALAACPAGRKGTLAVRDGSMIDAYRISIPSCKIGFRQTAKPTANSRVHVTLAGKCLRTTQSRKPVCGSKPVAKTCKLAGGWSQTTETVGSTAWTTSADGKAQESGLGNATGRATLAGSVLTIVWTTADGWGGVYRWTLDKDCAGTGTLSFTKGPRAGDVLESTVRGRPS